jgi:hypothetical protein
VLYQLSYVPVFTFGNSEPRPHTPLPQAKKDSTAPIADGARGCIDSPLRCARRSLEDRPFQRLIDVVQRHDVALGTLRASRERGISHAGDTLPFLAFAVATKMTGNITQLGSPDGRPPK